MPKGRGANKRRWSGRQWRPKDKRDAQDRGAAKQFDLLRRANDVAMARREGDPVAAAVKEHFDSYTKAQKAKHKRRRKWSGK
jgi:hypothetical protein